MCCMHAGAHKGESVAVDVGQETPEETMLDQDEKDRAAILSAWHSRPGDKVRCWHQSHNHEADMLQHMGLDVRE